MDLVPRFQSVKTHWRLIAIVATIAALVAFGTSYLFAPSYSASTKILVRARETRFLTTTGQDLSNQLIPDATLAKSLGQTDAGLVKSRVVAEEVVTKLKLDAPVPSDTSIVGSIRGAIKQSYRFITAILTFGYYAEPSAFDGAVANVQNQLEATPIKDSYLIEVKAASSDPDRAAAIANAAAEVLVRLTSERAQQDANAYREFLKGQVDRSQADVDKAQAAMQTYKEQEHLSDSTLLLRSGGGSQGTIQQQLSQAEVDIQATQAQLDGLVAALAGVSRTDQSTSTLATGRSTTTTTDVSPSKVYQDLLSLKLRTEADLAALTARRTALLAASQGHLASNLRPDQEARLNQLDLSISTATDTYRAIVTSYQQALVASALGAVEVSQADRASAPLYPDRPLRYLFALLGVLIGVVGGSGLAIYLDRRRRAEPLPQPTRRPVPQPGFATADVTAPIHATEVSGH